MTLHSKTQMFSHSEGQHLVFGSCPYCRMQESLQNHLSKLVYHQQEHGVPIEILQAFKQNMTAVINSSLDQMHKELHLSCLPAHGKIC